MSLFVVNRYQETDNLEKKDQEAENLSRLKKLIEERRKAKENKNVDIQVQKSIPFVNTLSSQDAEISIINNFDNVSLNPQEVDVDANSKITITPSQFKVIGTNEFEKKTKVKRILPYWLSNPTPVSVNLQNLNLSVDSLEFLDSSLKKKLKFEGIQHLFPVQAQVIPWLLAEHKKVPMLWPRDMCVCVPTGSGKTLAYVLPIVQLLANRVTRQIRALIILPVKELAIQVAKVFKEYCIGTDLKVAIVAGSVTFQQEQSQLGKYTESCGWRSEVDILVCTAGRLVEHIRTTEGFSLKDLKFMVMDEADRIMNHIQNDWLHHLNHHIGLDSSLISGKAPPLNFKTISAVKRPPQKLFFSATLSQDPEKLNQWGLFQPKLFSVSIEGTDSLKKPSFDDYAGKYITPLELTEKYVTCSSESKPLVFYHLLNKEKSDRVLCFTNSAQSAHRLTILMNHFTQGNITVAEISAALNRNSREKVLKQFQNGSINVLISTDALARGIDIPNCNYVISYDPPKNVKTYIHRVGRTGRAGQLGTAVAIIEHNQLRPFQDILKQSGKLNVSQIKIDQNELDGFEEGYKNALIASKDQIQDDSHKQITRLKALKRGRKQPHSDDNKWKRSRKVQPPCT